MATSSRAIASVSTHQNVVETSKASEERKRTARRTPVRQTSDANQHGLIPYIHPLRSVDAGRLPQLGVVVHHRLGLLVEGFKSTLELLCSVVRAACQRFARHLHPRPAACPTTGRQTPQRNVIQRGLELHSISYLAWKTNQRRLVITMCSTMPPAHHHSRVESVIENEPTPTWERTATYIILPRDLGGVEVRVVAPSRPRVCPPDFKV